MSTHSGIWVGEYNHQRYVEQEIPIVHSVVELDRRGIYSHARYFPQCKVNGRYLTKFVRPLYKLENAVDSLD